jgi:hypothetical protein
VPADEFDPERILTVLARHGVDCLIVGGFGAQAHGAHRQTLDIDLVPRSTDENLERLAAALRELGSRLRVGGLTDEEARRLPVIVDAATLRGFASSTWMTDAGPVDVLADLAVAGGRRAYEELASRAVPRSVHGVVVYLASLADIIASKEFADREKDRAALPELIELQRRGTGERTE